MSEHLLPFSDIAPEDLGISKFSIKKVASIFLFTDRINKIGEQILSVKQRLNFIETITKEFYFDIKQKNLNCLSLLIDEGGEVIDGKDYIYTPASNNTILRTPSFANIHFINDVLFDGLVDLFKFNEQTLATDKGRFVYDKLSGYCNIHSYEPANLVQKIISETVAKRYSKNIIEYIMEMYSCLFYNFLQLSESTKNSDIAIVDIPCISINGKVKNTSELTFSNKYPSGMLASRIFEKVLDEGDLVASPINLGIHYDNINEVDRFLKWLKVNEFLKINKSSSDAYDELYVNWVADRLNIKRDKFEIQISNIKDFPSVVSRLTFNQLVCWLHFDRKLNKQFSDKDNLDVVKIKGVTVYEKPSFLKFRFLNYSDKALNDHLLDEKLTWLNKNQINFNDPLFLDFNLSKSDVVQILMLLGAKTDFSELSIKRVAEILNELPEHYPDGKNSQTIYKKALQHYLINKKPLPGILNLFANNGDKLINLPADKIYYSDKIKLPQKLKVHYPIFNFPSRSGGAEAISFFKINDLKKVEILINEKVDLPEQTSAFKKLFEFLKPYILSVRLDQVDNDNARKALASTINKIDIVLCAKISFEISEQIIEVDEHEFLFSEDTYYVKIREFEKLSTLIRTGKFLDSISEIIANSFDVNSDKAEFKMLFRSKNNDISEMFEEDYGKDLINEARMLLGLSDNKFIFWKAIFESKGGSYSEKLDDNLLEEKIEDIFKLTYGTQNIDYDDLGNEAQLNKVVELFKLLDINPIAFNNQFDNNLSFEKKHLKALNSAYDSFRLKVKTSLWIMCNEGDSLLKKQFLEHLSKFDNNRNLLETKAKEMFSEYDIDIEKIAFDQIYELFPNLTLNTILDLDTLKDQHLTKFTSDEISRIRDDESLRSLIYFQTELDEIRTTLARTEIISDKVPEKISDRELILGDVNSLKPYVPKPGTKRGIYIAKDADLRKRKTKGKTCEQIIFEYIKKLKLQADFVSEDNEGLHHDIRYYNEDNVLKYVEVKSYDSNKFFLSKEEYNFGKENKNNYEIWLLRNYEEIFVIKDFFDNAKYHLITNEFVIYLEQ